MISREKLDDLQQAANYRWLRKNLRSGGVGSIIFGALALMSGLPGVGSDPIGTGLAALGAFLLVEGLWTVISPTPLGIAVDGVALGLLGFWNILITVASKTSGAFRGFILLGILQIMWARGRFARYKEISGLKMLRPSDRLLKWMDNLGMRLYGAKASEYGDVIALQTEDAKKQLWKGVIFEDIAVFGEGLGDRLIFAGRDEVQVTRLDTSTAGDLARVTLRMCEHSITAVTPVQHLDRLEIWLRSLNEGDWAGFSGMKLSEAIDWTPLDQPIAESEQTDGGGVRYAGFWLRFAAFAIDWALIGFLSFMMILISSLAARTSVGTSVGVTTETLAVRLMQINTLIILIGSWLYFASMEKSPARGTLGKMAMGIAVTDAAGETLSFGRASWRYFARYISAILIFIGFFMAGFTARKQALHDIVCDTVVIRRDSQPAAAISTEQKEENGMNEA